MKRGAWVIPAALALGWLLAVAVIGYTTRGAEIPR